MYSRFVSKVLCSVKGQPLIRRNYISRRYRWTHYDTLQLPRTCTTKEIKEAFIELSKTCHPDRNQSDPENHARFVQLNEAYQILSRPDTRKAYDLTLSYIPPSAPYEDIYTTAPRDKVTWDQSFWENRDKSQDQRREEDNFYGIKGVRRVRNGWIAFFLIVFSFLGAAVQLVALHSGVTFSRQRLDERHRQASQALAEIRARNQHLTQEEKFDYMKERLTSNKFGSPPPQSPEPSTTH